MVVRNGLGGGGGGGGGHHEMNSIWLCLNARKSLKVGRGELIEKRVICTLVGI